MIKDKYLDISKITTDEGIFKIFNTVKNHGGIIRFVGGAVRDAIAGKSGFDLDLTTDLSPDELAEACEDDGIRTVPIGIKLDTLGVVINNTLLKISSLCKNTADKSIEFTDDWQEDASRRDLTINAVYADEDGNVFDYYNGISDLEKGIVRFIGDADQKIKEDYLRILRFFRFYSLFGRTAIDDKALQSCIDNKEGLKHLSIERISGELIKIISTPKVDKVLKIMLDNEILVNWLGRSDYLENLEFLIKIENKLGLKVSPLRRFFVLYYPDYKLAENIARRMHMTKNQRETMLKWADNKVNIADFVNSEFRQKMIYSFGKGFCIDKLLIETSRQKVEPYDLRTIIDNIENAIVPIFPVSGRDIIKKGVDKNQIGPTLERLKKEWLNSNFSLSRASLLEKI